jgi:tRNA pseudouridine38-40 synthase
VQPGLRTVQGELEAALRRITGEDVALTVAGRTDAGVHATAQVASFESRPVDLRELVRGVNAVLPRDVAVRSAAPAPDDFDARRSVRSRAYRYRVLAAPLRDPFEEGRALWWPHRLDGGALDACAAALPGTHDFTAFTPTDTEHVRFERDILRAGWRGDAPGILAFEIEADAFMRYMVRVLVGTMLEVAGARRTLEDFQGLLGGAPRARAGETAPAHGLYLVGVRY